MSAAASSDDNTADDGGWGFSSVSAALGGWGLGSTTSDSAAVGAATQDEGKKITEVQEDNVVDDDADAASHNNTNLILTDEMEETLDETAKMATAAAFSFFDDATNYLSSATAAENQDSSGVAPNVAQTTEESTSGLDIQTAALSMFEEASKMISSAYNDSGAATADNNITSITTTEEDTAPPSTIEKDALSSLLEYNPLNSIASSWINNLERQSKLSDPNHKLRSHLEIHLNDWPKSTYEHWVEEYLCTAGWDTGSAVVDDTFYYENSVHRNIWNERMSVDDPNLGGEGEEGGDKKEGDRARRYVPAKVAVAVNTTTPPRTPPRNVATPNEKKNAGNESSALKVPVSKAILESKAITASSNINTDDDNDLDNLLDNSSPKTSQPASTTITTPSKPKGATAALLEASALLEDDDDDLAGLLDDDDEVVFVSSSDA